MEQAGPRDLSKQKIHSKGKRRKETSCKTETFLSQKRKVSPKGFVKRSLLLRLDIKLAKMGGETGSVFDMRKETQEGGKNPKKLSGRGEHQGAQRDREPDVKDVCRIRPRQGGT